MVYTDTLLLKNDAHSNLDSGLLQMIPAYQRIKSKNFFVIRTYSKIL